MFRERWQQSAFVWYTIAAANRGRMPLSAVTRVTKLSYDMTAYQIIEANTLAAKMIKKNPKLLNNIGDTVILTAPHFSKFASKGYPRARASNSVEVAGYQRMNTRQPATAADRYGSLMKRAQASAANARNSGQRPVPESVTQNGQGTRLQWSPKVVRFIRYKPRMTGRLGKMSGLHDQVAANRTPYQSNPVVRGITA